MASNSVPGMTIQWSDLEQEPYCPEEFVERLAWRSTAGMSKTSAPSASLNPFEEQSTNPFEDDNTRTSPNLPNSKAEDGGEEFDAQLLNDTFVQAIKDLSIMQEKQRKKCQLLEQKCREEEQSNRKRVSGLVERNRVTASTYKSLDEKINSVATKVIHLGDQLESVNTPRSRDVEALKLMRHFEEFLGGETSLSSVFNDKSRLYEAADIIRNLQLIAQELPSSTDTSMNIDMKSTREGSRIKTANGYTSHVETFDEARQRIDSKYAEIEQHLLEEFVKSERSNDCQRMKDLAQILSNFKGYGACVDKFIEQKIQLRSNYRSGTSSNNQDDVFKEIVPLCDSSWKTISQVFPNPQQVMSKFVLNIYHNILKEHVGLRLADKNHTETYLNNLFQLYSATTRLTTDLTRFNVGSDHSFLSNLTKTIFRGYLETYINIESRYLNEKCTVYLQRFYESRGHQKKKVAGMMGGETMQGVIRDGKNILARANINIDMTTSYGGETFLSEEVAINLLQLTKTAFRRVQVLSNQKDMPGNAVEVFNILISYLLHEHIDYALEIGQQGIPLPECRTIPELYFFDVVGQTNAIIHLFEKQFNDSLLPLVASTPKYGDCLQRKKNELEKLEHKLDTGIDRTLSALAGWVQTILRTEQQKTDFNPVSAKLALNTTSSACLRVVKFVNYQVDRIRGSMDGKNLEMVLLELGLRLHRVIYDHLQGFTYSRAGVMSVIIDVQEYRKCVADFKVAAVNNLFDTLHAMCNLLILPPENLRNAAQGDQLAALDRNILDNWIQLRDDYKSERLGSFILKP